MAGAAAYSSSLIHETESDNKTVLSLIWKSSLQSYKKRFASFKAKVRNGAYPAHVESFWVIMAVTMALHFTTFSVPFDLVDNVLDKMPRSTMDWQLLSCFVVALSVWILISLVMRYTLKLLLMYKGFMFETRGKGVSVATKLWAALVKVFVKWNTPSLYSFQGSLPRLPLPSVEDTINRYLLSVRPLLNDENYEKITKEANAFKNGIAKKLQYYLVLKSWWSSNYVSDWWEQYVYLRSRDPLMYGSNYYGSDSINPPTKNQAARAAQMSYLMLQFRRKIERQELKPIMVQGLVPLCSSQYERMFNTVRVPGMEADAIVHYDNIKHIVVLSRGCYYKMMIYHEDRLLKPCELQYQIEEILKKTANTSQSEKYLASLTAWNRTKWAEVREKYFSTGVNKLSLQDIESAAFVLVLEEEPFVYDLKSSVTEYGKYARQLLHGKGYDRWFDKSFNFCVATNGKGGLNGEHTWADAPVLAQMFEDCLFDEYHSYDANGNTKGTIEIKPPPPTRLTWDFANLELQSKINEANDAAQKIIDDVDHQVMVHDAFGKGFIKTCKLSPDAYIQMALQLAYYRDYGKFSLTYEASMTRLFRDGRTETVRPCTIESSAWVKAMEDPNFSTDERVKLLRKACDKHQQGYLDAMCGRGVDRHLFCLYVVSKYLEMESPFLQEAISEPWRLTTSQTPLGQTPKTSFANNPNIISASGGFGPVSRDGYSTSYIIYSDDIIFFHVSSVKSCEITSTDRFMKRIVKAMNDIKLMFEDYNKTH